MKHLGAMVEWMITGLPGWCRVGEGMIRRTKAGALFWIITGFVFAALFPAPSFAEDFTFNVPVELKNLPPTITMGRLECLVSTADNSASIGVTDFDFAIVAGNYSNTVVIKFNAIPGRDPKKAAQWGCALFLKDQSIGVFQRPSILLKDGGAYPGIDTTKPFNEISNGTVTQH